MGSRDRIDRTRARSTEGRYRKETPGGTLLQLQATPAAANRASGAYAKPARILVVDDYRDARDLYRAYLLARGHMCDVAVDGADAIAKAHVFRPDVIVMDIAMPVLDGWAAIRGLRARPETARSAIIVLTGQEAPNGDAARQAAALGVRRFFTKPCLPRVLAQAIADVLEELGAEVESPEPAIASRR